MLRSVPIRVVLAEDNYLVREGLRRLLETQPDVELAAVCEDPIPCSLRSRPSSPTS
jgi:DNA-binding NarL/FixJ family response regulator